MHLIDRLKSEYFPRAVKEGKFGKDTVRFLDFKSDDAAVAGFHACSTIYFGDVILATNHGDEFAQSVVIKARDEIGLAAAGRAVPWLRLYNEYLFYTEILPLLQRCDSSGSISDSFPAFIFGRAVSSDDDTSDEFLVFDNAHKRGFRHSPSKIFIDNEHLKLLYRKIANFHALSLVAKRKYPDKFTQVTSKIRELLYLKDEIDRIEGTFGGNAEKSISNLRNDPNYRDKLLDLIKLIKNTCISASKAAAPSDPLTVICHMDLQKNNMFFRYDPEQGTPTDVMFYDMAFIRYASPTLDLSYPLFANVSPEMRNNKWEELLRIYHLTLTSCPDLEPTMTPTFDDLILDFRRRAFHGYVWASVFLTVSIARENLPEWEEDDEIKKMSTEEKFKMSTEKSGEKGTFYLTEIVKFMIDQRFDFRYFLDSQLDS